MAKKNKIEKTKQKSHLQEGVEPTREGMEFVPPTDIMENNENIVLTADMPGVKVDDVDITLEKGVLTIHGTVGNEHARGDDPAYSEYDVGNYRRSFSLTSEINSDKIQANMKNGVLTLTLPKVQASRRKIEVKSS